MLLSTGSGNTHITVLMQNPFSSALTDIDKETQIIKQADNILLPIMLRLVSTTNVT